MTTPGCETTWLTGIGARNACRKRHQSRTLMLLRGNESYRAVADRASSGVGVAGTFLRYSAAWPIFMARETLAAWDDGLAFWMNFILGDDWDDSGSFDDARRSRRRRAH